MSTESDTRAIRTERDELGARELPADAMHGIHTARAFENFSLADRPVHAELVHAYGDVKLACVRTAAKLGVWPDPRKAAALEHACQELAAGELDEWVRVDALQGGAGTSLNMNVNEVLANRALQHLGLPPGRYDTVSPTGDVNVFQSTNDTFPTALRVAAIRRIRVLEQELVALQEAFQQKEKELADIVKIGRTEMQDAVLITLGREMGAYAEAFNRDRWRLYKTEERLRVVNLGGTAVGTGLGAPRTFIFQVVDELRAITGIGLSRAENLVEATQNADVFAEVSGLLRTCATSMIKVSGDLRLLSSGPDAGLAEIRLPARQEGSSIMPGKVNPVIPEAVTQAAMLAIGYDMTLTQAVAAGSLELNPFLPLIAFCLLESVDLLARAAHNLRVNAVEGLEADRQQCRRHLDGIAAVATALIPALGHDRAAAVAAEARAAGSTVRAACLNQGLLTADEFDALVSPEAVCRLGSPEIPRPE
jgi:aspartate ammonia-lyase